MKNYAKTLALVAAQLPLAGIIATTANAESHLSSEQLEALVRAQAVQIERLGAEMKALKRGQQVNSTAPQQPKPKAQQAVQTGAQPASPSQRAPSSAQPPKALPLGPPVAYPVAYTQLPPQAATPGAMGSPQYPNYVIAGPKPLSWMLPYSDISLQIGGYAKLDAIGITGGNRSVGAGDQFNVYQIQPRGTATGTAPGDSRANIHARQTRLYIEADKTDTPLGPSRFYVEGDFFGPVDLGTPTVSNSHTFRLRHAYAEVGNLLAGQTWSTYIDPSTYPELLDFSGPGGSSFLRQGQIRWTQRLDGGFSAAVAVENPQSRVRIGTGPVSGTGSVPASFGVNIQDIGIGPFAADRAPDVIGRIKYESPQFNLMLSGVVTRNSAPPPVVPGAVVPGDGEIGFATQLSGQIALPFLNSKDNLRFMTGYLDGASRYMLDVASTAPSIAYDATLTRFERVKAYGGFGGLQHWWTDKLRSNFVYSVVNIDNPAFSGPTVISGTRYGVANLLYSPFPEFDIGAEFQYGKVIDADGTKGYQTRVQSSLIYRF